MEEVAVEVEGAEREVEEENRSRRSGAKEDIDDNTQNKYIYDRNFLSDAGSGEATINMSRISPRFGLHEGSSYTANEQGTHRGGIAKLHRHLPHMLSEEAPQ